MKENLEQEQQLEMSIQPRGVVPGVPGALPNYMEEFPAEATDTTKYDSKNAIWNSGAQNNTFRNVSFASSNRGLQFRSYVGNRAAPGAPGIDSVIQVRVKDGISYKPWYEIYHTENLDPSQYALKTSVDSSLASKADRAYVDSGLSTKMDKTSIDAKADKTYVDANLALKADAAEFTVAKQDLTLLKNNFPLKADKKTVEESLMEKADKKSVYEILAGKADKDLIYGDLAKKADHTYVDSHLAPKADKTYVDNGFATKTELELVKCQVENLKLRIAALEAK